MTEIKIRVKPTRTLFFAEDTFFGIWGCEVNPDDHDLVKMNKWKNISVKGIAPKLNIGQEYTVLVKEDSGSKYAGSYEIVSIKQDRPETVEEQRKFFEQILTTNQVNSIYEVYGEDQDVVGMIEKGEFDYKQVKGLGDKTFEKLREKVLNNIDMSEVLTFLSQYEIKYNLIAKLVKEYKNPQIVIEKIKQNPYLLTEIRGIGFKKADEIAKAVGYDMHSPHRIASAIRYIIGEENQSGHSWISYKTLLNRAIELLNINKQNIIDALEGGFKGVVRVDEDRFTTKTVYEAEKAVSLRLTELKSNSTKVFESEEIDTFLNEYCEENGVELEENQRQFFHDWNENQVLLLVGGGGMGKSWLQRILLKLVAKKNWRTALLAPTGKASKVMTNYSGHQAMTIHRKVGVFGEDEDGNKEVTEDVIIIDEASMCDVFILKKLLQALTNHNARVLFVGDDFQLPSVGVGNFLYDAIHSAQVKVSRLKKVFRQAEGGILNVATDVREGNSFLNGSEQGRKVIGKDCVFWLVDSDYIRDGIISNYTKVISSGRWTQDDVVILTPTNKGKLGTVELNKEIQKIANPQSPTKKEKAVGAKGFETIYRVGDNVMNLVNTYDIDTVEGGTADIFNGDTGKIIDINDEKKSFVVEFDGIMVYMPQNTILTNLSHAWVTTIHKSQGSQYKVVIMIADKSMTYQLNANLLYTGLSRAKEYELVLTQSDTINRAMKKHANMERRSFLQEMLDMFNNFEGEEVIDGYEEVEKVEEIA